jgi:hypothetical protein
VRQTIQSTAIHADIRESIGLGRASVRRLPVAAAGEAPRRPVAVREVRRRPVAAEETGDREGANVPGPIGRASIRIGRTATHRRALLASNEPHMLRRPSPVALENGSRAYSAFV